MATAEQIQQAKMMQSTPSVTQRTKFRKFKGFNPKQRAMVLEAAGQLDDGSSNAATVLAEATQKATNQINKMYNGGLINAAEGTLVKVPGNKHWQIQSTDPATGAEILIDTGRKSQGDATKALDAYEVVTSSEATATGELVRENGQWSVQMQDAEGNISNVPTGKTNKNLAAGLANQFVQDPQGGGDDEEGDPVVEEEAPVNALDYTDDILTGEQGLNPNATAQAVDITDAQVAAGNVDATGTSVGIDTAPTVTATQAPTAVATTPAAQEAVQIKDPTLTQDAIDEAAQVDATKGVLDAQSTVDAQTMDASDLSALDLESAQIADEDITQVEAVDPRVEQTGEMISKYDADASTAAEFAEEVKAAQGEVSTLSTVKGQLSELQKEFDNNEIPMWASGAYRQAQQGLAARGLSGSSMAGQALVQAFMEASLPIAAADAKVYQEMDMVNLSNKQQRAMLAAQQRATFIGQEFDQAFQMRVMNAAKVSDIANMNFSAEQQVALENARLTQTVNLANLSNRQAKIMADAASMTQIEMINLNNRQQAAVANAQAFLQMDMTNLAFDQQTAMFEAQSRVQSLFTDAAAENAAKNINAQSSNDMNKFFASLINNTDIQNASSMNGMAQFNTNAVNSIAQFNSQMINQRELWNAENARIIAESNANWRRAVTTTNNATQNAVNQMNAQNEFGLQTQAYANVWQRDRDIMNMTYQTQMTIEQQAHEIVVAKMGQAAAKSEAGGILTGAIINGIFDNYTSIFGGAVKAVTT
mgnify:FL=1|tara:strand:- start:8116 stop:10398 length:2283 start_codon:yes stop_codon:yes gene_type:complete